MYADHQGPLIELSQFGDHWARIICFPGIAKSATRLEAACTQYGRNSCSIFENFFESAAHDAQSSFWARVDPQELVLDWFGQDFCTSPFWSG